MGISREVENDNMVVEFEVTDESFDHAFGREKKSGYEINKISVYIPAIDDWWDQTHSSDEKLWNEAKRMVEKEIKFN